MRIRTFWPAAAALALALPVPATGQDFATDDPAYSSLYPLEAAAERLIEEGPQDGPGKRAIIAELEKLRAAALATKLPDGNPHPLAALADIKIASELYALGENLDAIERGRRGIDRLGPYVASYPLAYAEAAALIGVLMSQAGQANEALPIVRQGHERYAAFYATLAEADRSRGAVVAKSNLEFSLAQILTRLGDTGEALNWQQQSLATRRAGLGENDPDTVSSWYQLAQALLRAERTEEAEAAARKAVELAVANNDPTHPSHARALEMLGIVLSRTGRPVEATDYLTAALAIKRVNEGTENTNFAYGVHNLASILFNRERFEDAEPFFFEADAAFRAAQGENSPFAAGSIAFAGQIALAHGRPREAVDLFLRSEKQLGDNKRDEQVLLRLNPDLIVALAALGRIDEARARADKHRALVLSLSAEAPFALASATLLVDYTALLSGDGSNDEAVASAASLLRLIASEQAAQTARALPVDRRAAIDVAMDVAVRTERPELMLEAMRLINASGIALASKRRRERLEAGDPELARSLRRLQDAASGFEKAEGSYLAALATGNATAIEQADRGRALAQLDAAREEMRERFPEWSDAADAATGGLAELAASLAPREAILAVAPVHRSSFVLLITRDRTVALKAAPSRAEMVALARRLGDSVRSASFDSAASRALHEAIFPEQVAAALEGIETLRIQAGGALASLPFSILQAASENGEQGWLIDRFALVSLSDLTARPAAARGRKEPRFLAVAAPVPFGSERSTGGEPVIEVASRGGGSDAAALSRLPALTRSRAEAQTIAGFFGLDRSRLLLGAEASEAGLRRNTLRDASIVLFATHGLISGEMEGTAEPALVLSPPGPASANGDDGLLTASEIATLDLDAELVILSACNSAAGGLAGLPAFSGLAQAFRQAGADTLMVSHWPVRDDVAAYLSIEALKAYRAGMTRPQALREAMRELRADRSIEGAAEPYVWAPFVLLD